jgi:hypothetical protein
MVCIEYAKSFSKVKGEDQAKKLLSKSLETPSKPAKSDQADDKEAHNTSGAKVAAEFDALPENDDSALARKSKRGMFVRISVQVLFLTRV